MQTRTGILLAVLATAAARSHAADIAPPAGGRPPLVCSSSQARDWLTDVPRFGRPEYRAERLLDVPEWLTFAVDHRTRYEVMDARFRAGERGRDHQVAVQSCLFLEASGAGFRGGLEFLDARALSVDERSSVSTSHANPSDVLQLYLAWSTRDLFGTGWGFEAKGGRQTLDLGSRRLVARNAFRNTVNAFTGLSLRLREPTGQWQLLAFATQPVARLPTDTAEILDDVHAWDEEEHRTVLSGVFVETAPLWWGLRTEGYLFHLTEDDRPGIATRNRQLFTPGFRLLRAPAPGALDLEIESVVQFGTSRASTAASDRRNLQHAAWLQHLQAGYTFRAPWSPRLLAQYDYASGDDDPTDRVVEGFDPLFGARRWEFGPTGIFGAFSRSNINSPGGRVFLSPRPEITVMTAYRAVWLASSRDRWSGSGLQDATGRSGAFVGQLVEGSIRWDPIANLSFEAGYAVLLKGGFARSAPQAPADGDVQYGYVQTLVRF